MYKTTTSNTACNKKNEVSDYVSNLTIVEKKTKDELRLCIDPQELNSNLKDTFCLMPTIEEVTAQLAGKKYFTVLDLKDGYWQMKLDECTSKLCTFSTPFGNYRFLRMPFGIKIAAQMFQKYNQENFRDIKGVLVYIDDILIAANIENEHDETLNKVMQRARERNVKFNMSKIQYKQHSVNYLGHIMSESGIACDPDRIKAIQAISAPKTRKDLQKLIGMINYVSEYIHNLSELSTPLRELLKKNSLFVWNAEPMACLDRIKKTITEAPTLMAFNEQVPVTIETDASQHGIGCCLMQEGRPVWFASRSLSTTEINYAQIEKEMLANSHVRNFIFLFMVKRSQLKLTISRYWA